jgi:hypothetical protein
MWPNLPRGMTSQVRLRRFNPSGTGSQPLANQANTKAGMARGRHTPPAVQNPRVERLSYEFRSLEERHDFSRAAAWEGDLGDFRCRLDQGTMEARPRADYTSADAARQALERHLRAWELWAELTNSIRVQFRYKSAQVVDRQSTPDSISVAAHTELAEVAMSKELATSPLVEELLGWVRDLREARQRMLVLAYLFVTRLTYEYNSEAAAAAALKVSRQVLVTLRKLAAKNDPGRAQEGGGSDSTAYRRGA